MKQQTNKMVKKLVEKVDRALLHELDQEISRSHADLFAPDSTKNAQIPESIFVQEFLPFFSGQVQDNVRLHKHANWIGVAGTPMNAVDVIDAGGDVLYTVPPLWTSEFMNMGRQLEDQRFSQIIRRSIEQSNRLPQLGDAVLGTQGVAKLANMQANPSKDSIQAWNHIYERYNIKPVNSVDHKLTDKQQTNTKSIDDELDLE